MNLVELDLLILKFFNQPFILNFNIFFVILIFLVYPYLVFLLYHFFKTQQKRKLYHLITVAFLGYIFVIGLKYLIDRPRPYQTFPDINMTLLKVDPSFPSSHTFIAFLLTYFIPKHLPKFFRLSSIFYLILLIPLASMYIGVHYPSDLIGGALLGLLFPRIITEKISLSIFKRLNTFFP